MQKNSFLDLAVTFALFSGATAVLPLRVSAQEVTPLALPMLKRMTLGVSKPIFSSDRKSVSFTVAVPKTMSAPVEIVWSATDGYLSGTRTPSVSWSSRVGDVVAAKAGDVVVCLRVGSGSQSSMSAFVLAVNGDGVITNISEVGVNRAGTSVGVYDLAPKDESTSANVKLDEAPLVKIAVVDEGGNILDGELYINGSPCLRATKSPRFVSGLTHGFVYGERTFTVDFVTNATKVTGTLKASSEANLSVDRSIKDADVRNRTAIGDVIASVVFTVAGVIQNEDPSKPPNYLSGKNIAAYVNLVKDLGASWIQIASNDDAKQLLANQSFRIQESYTFQLKKDLSDGSKYHLIQMTN